MYDILEIIEKKNNQGALNKGEIDYAVMGYVNNEISDDDMTLLLKAIMINGMSDKEIIDLTDIMLHSGEVLELDFDSVDKHSTGGVGDKTTIVLAPLVAALGVKVAKMSGRSLGHTGGTIDKLESISGFQTKMTLEEVQDQVDDIGVAIVGQMNNLCPADKKIYALRDVTGTVKSIPLIASSIMSKKLASGASKIVIDLKVGNGALMTNMEDAKELARIMVKIGHLNGKDTICVLTNMDEPLGNAVGNSLEVIESIETLKGNGPSDLNDLVINFGSLMLSLDKNMAMEDAIEYMENALKTGVGYEKFKELVKFQHGDINDIKVSSRTKEVLSSESGYIKSINALKIGELARKLGAGRLKKDDVIDSTVGFVLHKKVSDKVEVGESLVTVYYNDKEVTDEEILSCFEFSKSVVSKPILIYEIIR
ncbi:MAG: thymidine phosphorylase [Bacilli bacterium]|nr:thymidine phosphorylase [Bacilli bacterium]